MSLIDMTAFESAVRADFEFKRETRYLTGAVKVGMAGDDYILQFRDGDLVSIGRSEIDDGACKIVIRGDRGHWDAMLQEKPRPFFQCLQSTAVKHALHLSDGQETFAYLPALNRMMSLMRRVKNTGH